MATGPTACSMSQDAERLDSLAMDYRRRADELMARSSAIVERFDGGQPIILGHHSQASAVKDQGRSDALIRRATTLYKIAEDHEFRAKGIRNLADSREIRSAAGSYTATDISKGDVVWTLTGTRKEPWRVIRANAKSVTVGSGYSWNNRLRYDEIVGVTKSEVTALTTP